MQALFQVWAWIAGLCDSNLPVAVVIPGLGIVQDAHGWTAISEQNHLVAILCFPSVCVVHILTFSLPSGSQVRKSLLYGGPVRADSILPCPPPAAENRPGRSLLDLDRTYLRNETSCPKGLRDYWLGHTGDSMDDLYYRVKDDEGFRRKKAEEYGIGFNLPSIVSNVPKIEEKDRANNAA